MELNRIYFFTASILKWQQVFTNQKSIDIVLESLKFLAKKDYAKIYAYVIMPNHIHLIWKPQKKNVQLSFMKYTAQMIKFHLERISTETLKTFMVNKKDRKFQIWQRNPMAIELYSKKFIEQKLDYIHNNPVQGKWFLVNSPIDYEHSSASFYESSDFDHPFLTHYMDDI